jgi:nucleoside-diphosphate-sugar epimerase
VARKKVLITGAAGRIGKVLTEGLHERYQLRVLYNRTVLDQQPHYSAFVTYPCQDSKPVTPDDHLPNHYR